MKRFLLIHTMMLGCMAGPMPAGAAVRYVNVNNTSPSSPYTTWAAAATTIQDAIDAAVAGDEIVVTNGVYRTGGRVVDGFLTNRVAVTKPLTVHSVHGPEVTIIRGHQMPGTTNGPGAVRCVYLINGATLVGFTLTNGATRASFEPVGGYYENYTGGGVWCESISAVVSNCVLNGNSANSGGGSSGGTLYNCILTGNSASFGGGVTGGKFFDSRLNNCTLTGNSAWIGGGAYTCTLNNCTLTGNSADYGGGASGSTLTNSIVYYNTARISGDNYVYSILNYCCTTPLPDAGAGNLSLDPELASASHITATSPCRGAGNPAYASGVDIDGEPWANPPSIGCDEFHPGNDTGPLTVALAANFTNVAVGFEVALAAQITGRASANRWEFGDGTVVSNRLLTAHAWRTPGDYSIVVRAYNHSNPSGVSASVTVHVGEQSVHYVAAGNSNPVAPYSSWANAANNIQEAVDAALPGAAVVVSNGVYQTGSPAAYGATVAVTKPLSVRSLNGPEVTVIRGHQVPGTTNGDGAVRCAYLVNGAALIGFTLTNGATGNGRSSWDLGGGGVLCESARSMVSNCVLTGNSAYQSGGGAYGGTFSDCMFTGNSATSYGGGAFVDVLNNCLLTGNSAYRGGGAFGGTLNNCSLTGNAASKDGGGVFQGTLNNCLLTGNSAQDRGGGACGGSVNNCTVTGNSASYGGGIAPASCAEIIDCEILPMTVNNSILYDNTPNHWASGPQGATINYSCTTPLPTGGVGNITNAPLFVNQAAGNFRLQSTSPCINAGRNADAPAGPDLDGNPRIVGGTVDIGAYEFQAPQSTLSYAWLQQYGLPTDGSADLTDPDSDGLNNWQEWRAWTDPTNSLSALRLLPQVLGDAGAVVRWQSVNGRTYFLERSAQLGAHPAFFALATDIAGQPDTTAYADTNAAGSGPYFYRVGVKE